MNQKQTEQALLSMEGKEFVYANQKHIVSQVIFDEDDEKVTIVTNLNRFSRKPESVPEFLKYWHPVNEGAVVRVDPDDQLGAFVENENSSLADLVDVLKNNIQRVQEDKSYIPQAKAINNDVNSIINIQKLKLDFIKQVRRR